MPKTPSAEPMPALVCVGVVDKVGEPKKSQTEGSPYWMIDITLKSLNAGKTGYTRFMANPTWFSPEFDVNRDLRTKGEKFVYGINMASADNQKPALLTVLLNNNKTLIAQLDEGAARVYVETNGDPEAVFSFIRTFLIEATQGVVVGYVLRQKRERIGDEEAEREDGTTYKRGIYFYDTRYEVGSPDRYLGDYFIVNGRNLDFVDGRVTKTKLSEEEIAEGANPFYMLKMTFVPEELGL